MPSLTAVCLNMLGKEFANSIDECVSYVKNICSHDKFKVKGCHETFAEDFLIKKQREESGFYHFNGYRGSERLFVGCDEMVLNFWAANRTCNITGNPGYSCGVVFDDSILVKKEGRAVAPLYINIPELLKAGSSVYIDLENPEVRYFDFFTEEDASAHTIQHYLKLAKCPAKEPVVKKQNEFSYLYPYGADLVCGDDLICKAGYFYIEGECGEIGKNSACMGWTYDLFSKRCDGTEDCIKKEYSAVLQTNNGKPLLKHPVFTKIVENMHRYIDDIIWDFLREKDIDISRTNEKVNKLNDFINVFETWSLFGSGYERDGMQRDYSRLMNKIEILNKLEKVTQQ